MNTRILAAAAFAAAGLFVSPAPASAQQQPEWFVPGQQRVPGGPRPAQPTQAPRQWPAV